MAKNNKPLEEHRLFWCLDANDLAYAYAMSGREKLLTTSLSSQRYQHRYHQSQSQSSLLSSCFAYFKSCIGDSTAATSTTSGGDFSFQNLPRAKQWVASCSSRNSSTAVVTDALQLKQAQVIFRHGARTPIWTIPSISEAFYDVKTHGKDPVHAEFEYDIKHLTGVDAERFDGPVTDPITKRYKRYLEGGMQVGQLTSLGMQQCYDLGILLRERYVEQTPLVSVDKFNPKDVYMRSTFIKRTVKSLQGVVAGFYRKDILTAAEVKPALHVAYYNEEILYPNTTMCNCLREIAQHDRQSLHKIKERKDLSACCVEAVDMPADTHISYVHWRDDLVARKTHNLPMPSALKPFYERINKQAALDIVHYLLGSPRERAAGLMFAVGPFHRLLLNNMDSVLKGHSAKLHLFSSHDSMLIPLLVALGCYDWEWPPYASYIIYELYQDKKTKANYVKVIYNGKELILPGMDSSLISLEKFKAFLQPLTMLQSQWRYLCANTRTDVEHPPIEYSLHYKDLDGDQSQDEDGEAEDEVKAPAGM